MSERMPAAFISHGSARMAIESNERTELWAEFGQSLPRPRAIVVISAHWYINASAVTAMARPRTVHDAFYQPAEFYDYEYPVAGDPELAEHIVDLVRPTWLGLDIDSWGLDHGAYTILAHAFPAADIPVVEMSVKAEMPFRYHVELGAQLAPLRDEGVLIVASGTLVHNGGATDAAAHESGDFDLAADFVTTTREILMSDPDKADELEHHRGYPICSPTPDHFLPVLYLAGLAAASGDQVVLPFDDAARGLGPSSFAIGVRAFEKVA
ncbi:MAG TPA: 4,5-DOPA dioxygenase extradiol [Acidimicrobiales bacterium]